VFFKNVKKNSSNFFQWYALYNLCFNWLSFIYILLKEINFLNNITFIINNIFYKITVFLNKGKNGIKKQ